MHILKILLGLFALVGAWSYIFHNKLIFRLNAWMRENVFSDQVVLFSGRRVAILLTVLGGLSLFSGLENLIELQPVKPRITAEIIQQARVDLGQKKYKQVISRCRELTKTNPDSVEAWELLVSAWSEMGEKEMARQAATVLLRLDPDHSLGKSVFSEERKRIEQER